MRVARFWAFGETPAIAPDGGRLHHSAARILNPRDASTCVDSARPPA